ncbi:hypothetical protein FSP39_006585 [Pinctada imbricata]|uniref:Uncharacterized protein n=1 Tax=Pinctada imbricata TaxID=66713 RepID=A0AA89C4T6_PINIB|nr:hypothetical protein FSP39_006585 [Pinctada imbricata]
MEESESAISLLELYDNCNEETSVTTPSLDFHGLSWQQLIQQRYRDLDSVSQTTSLTSSLRSTQGLTWQRFIDRAHYSSDLPPSDSPSLRHKGGSLPWNKFNLRQKRKPLSSLHYNTIAEGRHQSHSVQPDLVTDNSPKSDGMHSSNTSISSSFNPNYVYLHPGIQSLRRTSVSTSSDSGFSGLSTATGGSVVRNSSLLAFPIAVGTGLWRDNPEHDQYYTFCVSEDDVTKIISHLENQLSKQKAKPAERPPCESQEATNISPQVTFILDTYCHMYMYKKQDLRELKMLQKQENKQYQDLLYKSRCATETQDKKFELDMQNLVRNFDQDMETLTKTQKQQVEKAEQTQQIDMKNAGKRLKSEQEKEYKMFKEQQKQELKLLKQELDLLPRDNKKDATRKRREQKEIELSEKERQFFENQQERMEKHMKQLADVHRQKVALLESQFLQQKQQLLRNREAAIWELEKQQLHEKHQLAKSQLKDMFFLKRHQMLTRHQKEVEQMKKSNVAKEDEMQRRHVLEKKRLPKILKSEAKTRALMFKQSLRLSTVGSPEDDRAKMKQFEENEKKRMKAEQQRQEAKHKKQWEDLVFRNESSLRELEQLQAEKRKMLMEQETQKIKELDEQYANELREWKQQLVPRKQKLEEEFQRQKDEQEKFYGTTVITGNEGASSHGSVKSQPGSLRHQDPVKSRHSTII